MKHLNDFIIEKLKINKNTKVKEYSYHPKNYYELRDLVTQFIESNKNANLNMIDISAIDDLAYLFEFMEPENIDISEWDVSHVKKFNGMFENCEYFDCDLSDWDVSNATDIDEMFRDCKSLKSTDFNKWKIDNELDMFNTFYGCNKDIIPKWYKGDK